MASLNCAALESEVQTANFSSNRSTNQGSYKQVEF